MQSHAAKVHVCALRHLPDMVRRIGARRVVSAINGDIFPETPHGIAPNDHLKLDMHDIVESLPGSTAPAHVHVHSLIEFVEAWDRTAPLLIHCYAGLSRSTAAAFISLCALNPEASEQKIAHALRRSSDTAVPNRLFVRLADEALRRDGRMVAAVEAMVPHKSAMECIPFAVDAFHEAVTAHEEAPRLRSAG
jgi:predicted protein tyrosine phosphatase